MDTKKPENVDAYIAQYEPEIQQRLQLLRKTIRTEAPEAKEIISYGMPAYRLTGNLVYFGVSKNHIGFYPTGAGVSAFENELTGFKHSKGAIQFPHDRDLPLELVKRIVRFRVLQENQKKKNPK